MAQHRKKPTVFTDRENDVLREIVKKLVTKTGSQTKAAKILQTNQPTLSGFLSRLHGASFDFATKIAASEGKQVRDLLGWTSEAGTPIVHPARDRVVAAAAALDFSRASVVRLQEFVPKDGAVPDTLWWMRRLVAFEEEERGI